MIHLHSMVRHLLFSCLALVLISGLYSNHGLARADTGSVSGTVLDEQGEPVEGLIVQVWSNQCWNNFLGDATTDSVGNYLVENLPLQDVYVVACTDCTNINYINEWWDDAEGTTYCGRAAAVAVEQDLETSDIDFALTEGPRRINWTDFNVMQGNLQAAFDVLPGFNHLIEFATLNGPDGFSYEFDLQNDEFAWRNECSYLVAWSKGFGDTFVYGEYTFTIGFQDGVQVSESYDLQQVDVTAVDIDTMSHTVNPDGSMDFSWTSPVPGQKYQARIYQNGERVYQSGIVMDMESVQVSVDQLRCLVPGVEAYWEVRTYDDNTPANAIKRSGYKQIDYTPQDLVNRSYWFQAVKNLGNPDWLGLYFNIRPGSRDQVTSAVVTGPEGFTPYIFDLTGDWSDMTTESRLQMNGWARDRSAAIEPIVEGEYTLTTEFEDGHVETHSYTLSADDLTPVDADTMGYEIFENGAIWFYWSLPQGVDGQRYLVRIRSKDGSKEFVSSSPETDLTGQYFSAWDLRALPQGDQFTWFVRAYGGDDGTIGDRPRLFY
jgi:hypothetical protein